MASTTPVWERSKENAAPLERGRNVHCLERSFAQDLEQRAEKERMMEHYERLVRPTEQVDSLSQPNASSAQEEADDDPLIHWLSYIKYHQDAFPSDTHTQFLLFERCVRALSKTKKYANDVRFVRVCCMYAEKTDCPSEVFQHLYQQKIGQETAIFYMAWGFVAEKQENFSFAEEIFQKGMRKKAQPAEKLAQRYRQFQRRMTRYWLNATAHEHDEEEPDGASARSHRGVLGSLSEEAFRRNERTTARAASQATLGTRPRAANLSTFVDRATLPARSSSSQQPSTNVSNKTAFAIFVDHNDENNESPELADSSFQGVDRVLPRQEERRKENNIAPEPWNQRGALSVPTYARVEPVAPRAASAPFAIHVDEECTAMHQKEQEDQKRQQDWQRQHRDERTFRERDTEDVAERLAKDPLRYMKDPTRLAHDIAKSPVATTSAPPPVTATTNKKSNKLGFHGRLLKDEQGKEQCFAEERANRRSHKLVQTSMNFNMFHVEMQQHDSAMSLDDEYTDEISIDNASRSRLDVATPLNASTASSTIDEANAVGLPIHREEQTINTQLALKELSMMFSSPALNDSRGTRHGGGLAPILNDSTASHSFTGPILEEEEEDNDGDETADLNDIVSVLGASEHTEKRPKTLTFAIYEDSKPRVHRQTASTEDFEKLLREKLPSPKKSFAIFKDKATTKTHRETVSRADLEELMEGMPDAVSTKSFLIFDENIAVINQTKGLSLRPTMEIPDARSDDGDGDTATFSIFGDCLQVLSDELAKDDSQDHDDLRGDPGLQSPPPFGDISRILPSTAVEKKSAERPVYRDVHRHDVQKASAVLSSRTSAIQVAGSLVNLLMSRNIVDYSSVLIPSSLKCRMINDGTKLVIGNTVGLVERELGRGVYGVAVLLRQIEHNNDTNPIVLKVQRPEDCLAWEYQILERLQERVSVVSAFYPFPKPLSYVILGDGALYGMTSKSLSGNTIVDLVNGYALQDTDVPEEVALHYTGRMLKVLEILHYHGKILHCDTKPDNWVLEPSDCATGQMVQGADLCLIDFGRAVDLASVEGSSLKSTEVKLRGDAVVKEMRCVAMRTGNAWSYDADTFGVCASAHAMLFRSHIEVCPDKSGTWMPVNSFCSLKYGSLWTEVFKSLLNPELDDMLPALWSESLRLIRHSIEACLADASIKQLLCASLEQQSAWLTSDLRSRIIDNK